MRSHAKASSAGSTQRHAKGVGRLGVALLALALLVALIPPSASAVSTRPQLGFSPITGSGTGVPLHAPSGLAVDESSGNVFLDDGTSEGNVVDIFGAEGGVPAGVASPYQISGFAFNNEPSGAAVDNSATSPSIGALYVVDVVHNVVKKFVRNAGTETYEAAGELTPSSGALFHEPLGAAVDSKGNVFVADYGSSSVVEFDPTGTQLARIDVSGTVGKPSSVALDNAGDLFVQSYNNHSVYKYPANGSGEVEEGVFTEVISSGATGVAVDSGANELFVGLGDHVTQYDAATLAQQLEFGAGALGETSRIAVNSATGRIYVSDRGKADVAVFGAETKIPGVTADATTGISSTKATLNATVNPDGLAVTECKFEYGTTASYGTTKPCEGAIPVDSSDHPVSAALTGLASGSTYHFRVVVNSAGGANQTSDQTFETPVVVFTEAATAITGTGATLNGSVNPDGLAVTECKFEYGASSSYGSSAPCVESAGEIGTGTTLVPVHADLSGLNGGTTYHFRLATGNSEGIAHGADLIFTTEGPAIRAQSVEAVGAADVTLNAKINPKGKPTTYHVEYGTTAAYGQSSPESPPIGFAGDESEHTVSVHIAGLNPGTAYHFRFVATSAGGANLGADATFATYSPAPSFTPCPNDRFRTGFGTQLPDCRAYEQATPVDKHGANIQGLVGKGIEAASDGSRITFNLSGGLPTTGGASTLAPLLASRGSSGWSSDGLIPLTDPGFVARVLGWSEDLSTVASSAPGPGNVGRAIYLRDSDTANFQFGATTTTQSGTLEASSAVAGFAADSSHFIFESEEALAPGAVAEKQNLYDYDHGNLTLAAGIPAASATSCDDESGPACVPAPEGSFAGPYDWFGNCDGKGGGATCSYFTQNTISRDGSKVIFTVAGSRQLYIREDGTKTTRISASQRTTPDPNGERPAAFMAATPDGSKVFFTSCEKLTNDSTAVSNGENRCVPENFSQSVQQGPDLYSYDADTGELTDVTVDSNAGDPFGAGVLGVVFGVSNDGSYVYFAANGVLAPGATPGHCLPHDPAGDQCNLYVSHNGTVTFISRLSQSDLENWQPSPSTNGSKTSRVSADGHTVLFRSVLSLTGYDNIFPAKACQGGNGYEPCPELFRYVAPDAELACVSCNPTGTPPRAAVSLGGPVGFGSIGRPAQTFLSRNLSADGKRVFFDSVDPLLPSDTNGIRDVYEWEAKGSGSCETESQNGGCLYLLSSGTSSAPSNFADASTNGNDAFIFTSQQLVPGDHDQLIDIYDASADGGLASQHLLAPPTCSSTTCQANPAPPPDQPTASSVFSGQGNVHQRSSARKCGKGRRKVRHAGKVRCQKAHKQHKRHDNRGGSK